MSQCVTQPTLTREDLRTSESLSTVLVPTTITEEPTTSTILSTTTVCPTVTDSTAPSECQTLTSTLITVIPGDTVTTQTTVLSTIDVILTETTTLFTTSCSTPDESPPQPTQAPDEPTTEQNTPTIPSTSSVVLPESSTEVDTSSGTLPPTSTTSEFGPTGSVAANDSQKSRPNVAAIVGGSIGGMVGLLLLLGILWFFIKRRKRWDDIFDHAYNDHMRGTKEHVRHDVDLEPEFGTDIEPVPLEPKPYHYGLVGGPSPPGYGQPDMPSGNVAHTEAPHPPPRPPFDSQLSSIPLTQSQHGHHGSISAAHSLNESISSPPLTNTPSDAYLPHISSPQSSPPSNPPSLTLSSTVSSESTAPPPTITHRPASPVALLPIGPISKRPTATRTSTSESIMSAMTDYPIHRNGVLQVTNADVPKSAMSSKLSVTPASQPQAMSPLHLELEDDTFNPASLFDDSNATTYGHHRRP